jgi:hypothetical protein
MLKLLKLPGSQALSPNEIELIARQFPETESTVEHLSLKLSENT